MLIMASLFVRNVDKFELQRESPQKDLKIHLNYGHFQIADL